MSPADVQAGAPQGLLPLTYGDLKLPEFSEDQQKIRGLEFDFINLVAARSAEADELDGMKESHGLRKIDDMVHGFIEGKVKELGLSKEDEERTIKTMKLRDWTGVTPDTPEHFALRELIVKANRLKGELLRNWLEATDGAGFTPVAQQEYKQLIPAMAALDRLFMRWITPQPVVSSDQRRDLGFTNECAVTRLDADGKPKEVLFHEAYPEETQAICAAYESLLAELGQMGARYAEDPSMQDLIDRKTKYYAAVLRAFQTSDPKAWREADVLLPQQIRSKDDVFHVHPIEVGYTKDRYVRTPEIGLRAPDLGAERANQFCDKTKETMLGSLAALADELPAVEQSLDLVRRSNSASRHFLASGLEIDLKPAGQILPNEFKERQAGGVDSSLDLESVEERYPLSVKAFKAVFGERAHDELVEPRKDLDRLLGETIASHEFGHAVGLVDGTEKRLGGTTMINPYIEEWKATTAGLVANVFIPFLSEKKTVEDLKTALVDEVMMAGRYTGQRNHPAAKAYYRHSALLMKVAEDVGVLRHDGANVEQSWSIDLDDGKVVEFFGRLLNQFGEVMGIYGEGAEGDLREFLGENLQETPFMKFMAERVDAEFKLKDMPSVAECCELPPLTTRQQAAAVLAG